MGDDTLGPVLSTAIILVIPAQPSRTAWRVALRRAAHQLIDVPPVLVDPIAIPILGPETAAMLRENPSRFETGRYSTHLRAFLAARSCFAEGQLAAARRAGITQYIVLGAGLDTSAYRNPDPDGPLRVWEVDHPATQAWKRQLLADATIPIPDSLTFVPVDFERETLASALDASGFDPAGGAVFSWLGVVPYLSEAAIMATMGYVSSVTRHGGGIAFDFAIPFERLPLMQRLAFQAMAANVRAAGEPWKTFFDPDTLSASLRRLGFTIAHVATPAAINARYFAGRADKLAVSGMGHLMWAGTTPVEA